MFSAATGERLGTIRTGPSPHHVALLAGRAVVASHGAGAITVFTLSGRRIASIPVGRGPHGVALARVP